MTLRERIVDWLGVNERAVTPAQLFNTGNWADLAGTASGQAVTAETAMRAAQGACVRLLADDISSLPPDVFVKDGRSTLPVDPPEWLLSPTGRPTDMFLSYLSDWVTSIGTDGNAFTMCLPSVFAPEYLEVLDPREVEIIEEESDGGRVISYRTPGRILTPANLLHVPWVRLPGQMRGINPIQDGRESIGLELAAQKWSAAFFKNGGTLGGLISVPGGPETVDADKLREQFEARHKGEKSWWLPGVLTGGATFDTNTITPKEAELAPLWTHVLEEAMRVYHIPPHLLSVIDTGAAARASVEERGIGYTRHAIRPFATRFERSHSLLLPGAQFLKLNLNALMRGDAKTRGEYYNLLLQGKVIARDEVRDLEDLPYVGDLGWLETPNNNGMEEPQAVEEAPERTMEPPRPLSVDVRDAPVTVHSAPTINLDHLKVDDESVRQMTGGMNETIRVLTDATEMAASLTVEGLAEVRAMMAADRAENQARWEAADAREAARDTALERLSEPEVVHIDRDERGRPVGTMRQKGLSVRRQVIEYDDDGRLVAIKESA